MVCLIWKFSRGGQRTAFFQASQNGARTVIVFARHAGPFLNKDMALVFWDQYVRYPVVEFTTSTSADSFIVLFTRMVNMYGIFEEIKSDNELPFNGSKFSNFAQEQGFRHRKVTPAWARTSGDRERFKQMLKKSAKSARLEGKPIRLEVQKTIGNYISCYAPPSDKANPGPAYVWKRVT